MLLMMWRWLETGSFYVFIALKNSCWKWYSTWRIHRLQSGLFFFKGLVEFLQEIVPYPLCQQSITETAEAFITSLLQLVNKNVNLKNISLSNHLMFLVVNRKWVCSTFYAGLVSHEVNDRENSRTVWWKGFWAVCNNL